MPDDIYRRYQDFMIILLGDTHAWSFYLVLLFLNVIPTLLKELVISRWYKLPRFSSLTTKVLQQQELEVMYESTVSAQRSMEEENKRIKAMVTSFAPHRKSTHNFYLSSILLFTSTSLTTIFSAFA